MRWIDVFRIAIRMLQTNLLRSILTTMGIGVAISLIVILIGLGYGLQEIAIGSIIESKSLLSIDITQLPDRGLQLSNATVEEIKQLPGVKDASPVVTIGGEARIKDKLASVSVIAAKKGFIEMEGIALAQGKPFEDKEKQIIVSPQILDLLDVRPEEALSSTAKLNYNDPNNQNVSRTLEELTIVGITDGNDSPTVYVPYDLIGNEETRISSIKAVTKDRETLVQTHEQIIQKGLQAETLVETLDQARTVFRWVTIGLTLFGIIALVVASIGMFNTLTIALLERTREIGIMKAIGITDNTIKRLFLAEASILGFSGGVTGIFLGLSVDGVLGFLLDRITENFGNSEVDLFQYPTFFLLGILVFPIVLSLFTGLYPAIRASHLNPLRALKFE